MKDKIIHNFYGGIITDNIIWIVIIQSQINMILSNIHSHFQTTNSKLAYYFFICNLNELDGKNELAEFAIYTTEVVSKLPLDITP